MKGEPQKDNAKSKTLGPQAARLVLMLHERSRSLFTHADVEDITGLQSKSARNLVAGMVRRGVATRLKPGLFILVPFELGREGEYFGNPYVVARGLVDTFEYYVSHASAMDIHQMVTQPQLRVFVTSPKAVRGRTVLSTEYRFVRCKPGDMFGIVQFWATRNEQIWVSDLERTVIDGLKQPEYCGGITEVARGFRMRRDSIEPGRLVDYALRLDIGAVIRRLGFILETFDVSTANDLVRLRARLTPSYVLLDPLMPAEGAYHAGWRLRVNVEPAELQAIVST